MNDGGPAFPATEYYDEKPIGDSRGMSLRDWFAGQALLLAGAAGIVWKTQNQKPDLDFHIAAETAYRLADAMLKRREIS